MNPNQDTRAYIVHATEEQMISLAGYGFTFIDAANLRPEEYKNGLARALDLDALRLVLEAAKESTEREGESYENLSPESRAGLRKTIAAIAKLESLTK